MAKKLLLNVLVNVLGEFVDINEDNLNLAVWSGKIELNNLKLKADSLLQNYNLQINHGFVEKLDITIPWTSLLTSPVQISMEGILLDFGLIDAEKMNRLHALQRLFEEKLQKLKMVEQYAELSLAFKSSEENVKDSKKNASNGGYFQQWTSQIVDNLEITLKNIHLRYEDSKTFLGTTFAAGLTLQTFEISTCDHNWVPGKAAKQGNDSFVNKLAYMKGLGVYWQTNTTALAHLPQREWAIEMLGMIQATETRESAESLAMEFLLSPVDSSFVLKLTHNKTTADGRPKFDVTAESSHTQLQLDNLQYKQLLCAVDHMNALGNVHSERGYRPADRPWGGKATRAWWKYAFRLTKLRPEYVAFVKRRRKAEAEGKQAVELFNQEARRHMRLIEKRLPAEVLAAFTRQAVQETMQESKKKQAESKAAGSWWGWGTGPAVKSDGAGAKEAATMDIPLEAIVSGVQDRENSGETVVRLALNSSSSILVSSSFRPMVKASASMVLSFTKTATGFELATELRDLMIVDMVTETAPICCLLAVKKSSSVKAAAGLSGAKTTDAPTFSANFHSNHGKSKVFISALPVEITLNKDCIQKVMLDFQRPNNRFQIKKRAAKIRRRLGQNDQPPQEQPGLNPMDVAQETLTQLLAEHHAGGVELRLEISAPKVIIPEDCRSDKGYLLLDTGFLTVDGFFSSEGMTLQMKLSDVNAGLPLTVHDLYSLEEKSLYLIKPFDISMQVQNIDRRSAAMTVAVSIEPEVRGQIDSTKLARLLNVVNEATQMVSPPPIPVRRNTSGLSLSQLQVSTPRSSQGLSEDQDTFGGLHDLPTPPPKNKRLSLMSTATEDYQTPPAQTPEGSNKDPTGAENSPVNVAPPISPAVLSAFLGRMRSPTTGIVDSPPDPFSQSMEVIVVIPTIALDLHYGDTAAHQLAFEVRTLNVRLVQRLYDRQLFLDLSEMSIQDSFRAPAQRDLAWTPRKSGNLIHVVVTTVKESASPLYDGFATEVVVDFAHLGLNSDVNTIMHLKPFFEVLLAKKPENPPPLAPQQSESSFSSRTNSREAIRGSENNPEFGSTGSITDQSPTPDGMRIKATIGKISLDLLRAAGDETPHVVLDTAFSMGVSGMSLDLEMLGLMSAEMKLRSFEILDIRDSSRDYVYRKVFCPAQEQSAKHGHFDLDEISNSEVSEDHDHAEEQAGYSMAGMEEPEMNLLHLTYNQESLEHSFIDITLSNITSFVSIDTILDLTAVGMANFFALLALLARPAPPEAPAEETGEKQDRVDHKKSNTMNVTTKMNNSRLILLEDPTSHATQAVVGRCSCEVSYSREVARGKTTVELFESLHITVLQFEVFVLRDLIQSIPIPVLDPMDVECHIKKKNVNGCDVSTSIQLEVERVNARISFNDLLLAQAILSRRNFVEEPTAPFPTAQIQEAAEEAAASWTESANPSPTKMEQMGLSLHVGLHSLSMVVVNDFNNQNLPVLRGLLRETLFDADSEGSQLSGDGSMRAQVDFYNPKQSVWEPVLEQWKPEFKVFSVNMSKIFELKSDHTLQLTVSGVMAETLLRNYSVLVHQYEESDHAEAIVSDVVVHNLLGADVPIDLYESSSRAKLMHLAGNASAVLNDVVDSPATLYTQSSHCPNAVDVQFGGQLGEERLPILHLPLNISRPKAYNLQSAALAKNSSCSEKLNGLLDSTDSTEGGGGGPYKRNSAMVASQAARPAFVIEPIVEEVYEYARYDPLSGRWREPFLLGDPFPWADVSGTLRKNMKSIRLTTDRWEWQGKWEVDMDGVVGQEIDEEGWEYAGSSNVFSAVRARRCYKAMDCVRRRRWIRTRVPVASNTDDFIRPLTVFWDVQTQSNGSRRVELRSGLQMTNHLVFPLRLSLRHNSWEEEVVLGPVPVGETFSVPLQYSFANWVRFRPDFPLYEWSSYYSCSAQAYDFSSCKDALSQGTQIRTVCFRVVSSQVNKSLRIHLAPYVSLANKLLCDMEFRCIGKDGRVETGVIASGKTSKLSYINLSCSPKLAIKVGEYEWSNANVVTAPVVVEEVATYLFELKLPATRKGPRLVLSMKCSTDSLLHGVQVDVFSKAVLVDRTSLDLHVCSLGMNNKKLVRTTFSSNVATVSNIIHSPENNVKMMEVSAETIARSLAQREEAGQTHLANDNGMGLGIKRSVSSSLLSSPIEDTVLIPSATAANTSPVEGGAREGVAKQKLIKDILVESRWKYQLCFADVGSPVYTDQSFRWCHLPTLFRKQLSIQTSAADRSRRSSKLIDFETVRACFVFVFVDMSNVGLRWLQSDGFHRVTEIGVARRIHGGYLEEIHFAIFGRYYATGQKVTLRSNWNKQFLPMYSVFVLPANVTTTAATREEKDQDLPPSSAYMVNLSASLGPISEQLVFDNTYQRDMNGASWTEGGNHLCFFHAEDNNISVGVSRGNAWSEDLNIDMKRNSATKGSLEVDNNSSGITYQLSYSLQKLPGLYNDTQLVVFMPRFCILNCTDEPLLVAQRGSEKYLAFQPYQPDGWHKLSGELGTDVKIRLLSTLWSLGAIDVNEVGSSVLYVPRKSSAATGSRKAERGAVLHVEVKLAEQHENCSLVVIVWQDFPECRSALSVCNNSEVPVTVRQADLENFHDLGKKDALFELCVWPGETLPFGWADPEASRKLLVSVGEHLRGANKRIAIIDTLQTEQHLRLPYMTTDGRRGMKQEVILSILTNNAGKALMVSKGGQFSPEDKEVAEAFIPSQKEDSAQPTYGINVLLSSIGVSLVVEKPERRELLSLYVDWVEMFVKSRGTMNSFEFAVMDMQVDSYSETAIYPVLLHSEKRAQELVSGGSGKNSSHGGRSGKAHGGSKVSGVDENEVPFLKVSVIQETPAAYGSNSIVRYFAARLLPVVVELDSATMKLIFTDFLDDLKVISRSQAYAMSRPAEWLDEFNRAVLYPEQRYQMVDVCRSKLQAQQSKIFFRSLTIHPVKITLTFVQTTFPRRLEKETLQSTVLNVAMSLVGVDDLPLKLNSFEVEGAMESLSSLIGMITAKTIQDLRSQLTQIAGSLTMLGAPMGFARKLGGGMKAFFYEPYQGVVYGSHDFLTGIGKGTSGLVSGVVGGAMDSTAAFMGTASKGISYLSGDADYVRKRAIKRQQTRVNRAGIFDGIKDGSESIFSGFKSGVTGLVSKPMEGASKEGVGGFFKGMGLGLIGAAVKPVMGLTEGVTSVAHGISKQVGPLSVTDRVRPARALEPSVMDASCLVITPLNLEAAHAQEFVMKRASSNHYEDHFLSFIDLGGAGESIILSQVFVFWRNSQTLWGRVWANISHCVFYGESVGIILYAGGQGHNASSGELVVIPCNKVSIAKKVYTALAQNAHRMGNPAKVLPVDVIVGSTLGRVSRVDSVDEQTFSKHALTRRQAESLENMDEDQEKDRVAESSSKRPTRVDPTLIKKLQDTAHLQEIDGYGFGTANGKKLAVVTGSEHDILTRAQTRVEQGSRSWKELDELVWQILWDWECVHMHQASCRCCVTLFINRADSPIQITRVQLAIGRNVVMMGSANTGYEEDSRCILPGGHLLVLISAFPQSPLEVGHLKANINTAAFSAVVASTQRESLCQPKGGFQVGFLEKSVTASWCKYVIVIS